MQADLIIVPYFMKTHRIVMKDGWHSGTGKAQQVIKDLISELPYLKNPELEKRHVFMFAADSNDITNGVRDPNLLGNALLLHYVPRIRRNEVVMVPNDAGFGRGLESLTHPAPDFLFYMAGPVNEYRMLMDYELQRLRQERPELRINHYQIIGHRSFQLDMNSTYRLMSQSLVCPIIQGDLPWQKRFFDALAAGCVPLLVSYNDTSKACAAWSYVGGPCVEDTYPFTAKIDYTAITAQIDSAHFRNGSFAEAISRLDRNELEAKRRRLEEMRHLFLYDWTGASEDTFSATMEDICRVANK
jgi:hypothetical protein